MNLIDTIILGIVEGLTEFLPVSSTGHMILASWLLKMENTEFLKTFEIAIQLGAILAVLAIYYKRLLVGLNIYFKLAAAFLPAAVIGLLAHHFIKEYLFNVYVVSSSLAIGGVILVYIDSYIAKMPYQAHEAEDPIQADKSDKSIRPYAKIEDISYVDAIKIGLAQCVAMIPGVSRAAATIIGGIGIGFDARQATEFSFLLAIPTMFAATGYDLLKSHAVMGKDEYTMLAVGLIVAFIFAWLAVKTFITLVVRFGFKYFGWYRIILGIAILVLALVFHYNVAE